jgi:spore coat polysaccharide biosynthesis protein SpsF
MTPGIIVASRINSTRLPGKALKPFRETTVLGHCLKRCIESGLKTVLAVPVQDEPVFLDALNRQLIPKVDIFIGSTDDVLSRVLSAAEHYNVDPIVRVTGDCPLVEPGIIQSVVNLYRTQRVKPDIASNVSPRRTFARGLDVEVVSLDALWRLVRMNPSKSEREHVTLGLYRRGERAGFKIAGYVNDGHWPGAGVAKLCVDTTEDLRRLSSMVKPADPTKGVAKTIMGDTSMSSREELRYPYRLSYSKSKKKDGNRGSRGNNAT